MNNNYIVDLIYNFNDNTNINKKEIDDNVEDYFNTLLTQSLNNLNKYKLKKEEYKKCKTEFFKHCEEIKLKYLKDGITNDDYLNSLCLHEKMELINKVKEKIGFIYYPGCGYIYEVADYDNINSFYQLTYDEIKAEYIKSKSEKNSQTNNKGFVLKRKLKKHIK